MHIFFSNPQAIDSTFLQGGFTLLYIIMLCLTQVRKNNKKMSIYEILIDKGQDVKIKLALDMPTSDLLKLATQYVSFTSGYKYKMNQFQNRPSYLKLIQSYNYHFSAIFCHLHLI